MKTGVITRYDRTLLAQNVLYNESGEGSAELERISAMKRTSRTMLFAKLCTIAAYPLIATLAALAASTPAHCGPVSYTLRNFGVPTHVITVNLNSPSVTVEAQVAAGGLGTTESFRSMLRRTRPVAAVTGAFFDTHSNYPVGDMAVGGQVIHRGFVGDGVCVTNEREVQIVRRQDGLASRWDGYRTVVCGGPTLIRNGQYALYPRSQGFRDPSIFAMKPRTAVGHTWNNKLVMVSVNRPIYLRTLAKIMKKLSCQDAITFDGGSSTGLWFDGRILSKPGRSLTNLITVSIAPSPHGVEGKIAESISPRS